MGQNYNEDIDMAVLNATGFKAINDRQMDRSFEASKIREIFFTQNNEEIKRLLTFDLNHYLDGADIGRMKLITLDFFVPAFLEKICNVYDTPPLFKNEEGTVIDDERFSDLLNEVNFITKMSQTSKLMKWNNTALNHVKYNERLDKVFIDTRLQEHNCNIRPYSDYPHEWEMIAYKVGSDLKEKDKYIVWDRELNQMYCTYVKENTPIEWTDEVEYRVKGIVRPVGDNLDILAPEYLNGMPFTIYRNSDLTSDFWGYGMDAVIELVRSINVLLTITNDDTIQESIRLLILNFSPSGVEGEKGQMKAGLRHPLFVEEGFSDSDPKGQIVSADLYNDDVIKLIDSMVDAISSLHNIDNVLKQNMTQSLSGISLRLKNEPLLRQWSADINKVQQQDLELIKHIVSVNNYHRPKNQIDESIINTLVVEYQEPQVVTDIAEEYNLEKIKWDDGTSSPVLYVMRKNPEMSEADAKEYIAKNLEDMSEVFDNRNSFIIEEENDDTTTEQDREEDN